MAQLTDDFFAKIMVIEGGYQNIPSDNGNYCSNGNMVGTNMGMAAISVETWWGRCPSAAEMKALTQQDAWNFYSWYFNRFNLFQIQNQQFAELLMNNTMGSPVAAAKVEQRALVEFGYNNIVVDGQRGPLTIAALNDAWLKHGTRFYNHIRDKWLEYLLSLQKPQFHAAWTTRMNKYFPRLDEGMTSGGVIIPLIIGVALVLFFKRK